MQTQLASLLLIVSTVTLACVVVGVAAGITEQTLSLDDNPQVERIQSLLNETNTWMDNLQGKLSNQTMPATEP